MSNHSLLTTHRRQDDCFINCLKSVMPRTESVVSALLAEDPPHATLLSPSALRSSDVAPVGAGMSRHLLRERHVAENRECGFKDVLCKL